MTKQQGWKEETTRGTNTLDNLYYLGVNAEDNSYHVTPQLNTVINQSEQLGTLYPINSYGNRLLDNLAGAFIPCNGKIFHWMLGGASDQTTFVRLTPGLNKPSLSIYTESDHNKWEAFGCIMQQLNLRHQVGKSVSAVTSWMGMDHGASVATPTITYPESESESYTVKKIMDLGGSSFEYNSIDVGIRQALNGLLKNDDGIYKEIIDENPIYTTWTIHLFGDDSALRAAQESKSSIAVDWKVCKASSEDKYFNLTQTCFISSISPKGFFDKPDEAVITLLGSSPQVDVKGLNKSFYGL